MSETEGKALAARLERLGSESAYEVANETKEIKRKHPEKKLYPFHIGDLNWRVRQAHGLDELTNLSAIIQ